MSVSYQTYGIYTKGFEVDLSITQNDETSTLPSRLTSVIPSKVSTTSKGNNLETTTNPFEFKTTGGFIPGFTTMKSSTLGFESTTKLGENSFHPITVLLIPLIFVF